MNKKEIAKNYIIKIQDKWAEITNKGFLCYENNGELANSIIYELFEKDCFNETATYYKNITNFSVGKVKEIGFTTKILCEIEKEIYFQFDIITRYGIDIPQKISNGKFRLLNKVPGGWLDIWELLQFDNESEAE